MFKINTTKVTSRGTFNVPATIKVTRHIHLDEKKLSNDDLNSNKELRPNYS